MLIGHSAGSGVESPVAVETPDFMTVNAKVAYDIPVSPGMILQVNAGMQNIFNAYQNDFDQGWNRDSNYIYGPTTPRSIFCGVKLTY